MARVADRPDGGRVHGVFSSSSEVARMPMRDHPRDLGDGELLAGAALEAQAVQLHANGAKGESLASTTGPKFVPD